MHPHFIEICVLLLEAAPEDIPRSSQIRKLLQELREVRHAKIMHGLKELDGTAMKVLNTFIFHQVKQFVDDGIERDKTVFASCDGRVGRSSAGCL